MILVNAVFVFVHHTSVTNYSYRVTDHATDTNLLVVRHNRTSSSGIAGNNRQGRSIICQHGSSGLWNIE